MALVPSLIRKTLTPTNATKKTHSKNARTAKKESQKIYDDFSYLSHKINKIRSKIIVIIIINSHLQTKSGFNTAP